MNQRIANKLNSLAVSAYKVLGMLLLALILLGLFSYLGVQGFFFMSEGWVAPKVVSPTDTEILQLNAHLAQQVASRDSLLAKRREMEMERVQTERIIAYEQSFQGRFLAAMKTERQARARALRRLVALRQEYKKTAREIAESNRAYARMARERERSLYAARLVDREQHLTANHQLAQLAHTNLSLAERLAELQTHMEELRREVKGFDASLEGGATGLTTEVLLLEREYTRSVHEAARADDERRGLEESLEALDTSVASYDMLIATIRRSPWLEAIDRGLTVGFVPYGNLENARPGTPLYQCALQLLWCQKVGVVGHPLQGEVNVKHPVRQEYMRGVMVELELEDEHWAQEQLLHLGRPPLLL
ncbi:MAG TPA: hypothetical protein VLQ93_04765 [Myxococcaceae bacterium]|nr:hypothetical protein [Myxococcaceae bacterium]